MSITQNSNKIENGTWWKSCTENLGGNRVKKFWQFSPHLSKIFLSRWCFEENWAFPNERPEFSKREYIRWHLLAPKLWLFFFFWGGAFALFATLRWHQTSWPNWFAKMPEFDENFLTICSRNERLRKSSYNFVSKPPKNIINLLEIRKFLFLCGKFCVLG